MPAIACVHLASSESNKITTCRRGTANANTEKDRGYGVGSRARSRSYRKTPCAGSVSTHTQHSLFYTHTHGCTLTHMDARSHRCTHLNAQILTHIDARTHLHIYTLLSQPHVCTHAHACTQQNTHACSQTCTQNDQTKIKRIHFD